MISFLAAAFLAAAPVHVVSVQGAGGGDVLAQLSKLTGVTPTDASSLYAYLLRPTNLLGMQDFSSFTAAPVKGWPAAGAEVWTKGLAHCRALSGAPPWNAEATGSAVACAKRLSESLWEQYAGLQHAERVFELDVSINEKKNEATVNGRAWEPTKGDQLEVAERGGAADAKQLTERVVKALIDNRGVRKPRTTTAELAAPAAGGIVPFASEAKVTSAITFKKTCPTLPAHLTVTPAGSVADSLAARWTPAGASGPTLACTLTFSEHEEAGDGPMPAMTVVTAMLNCGAQSLAAEAAKVSMARRSPVDVLSERLALGLAAKLCR